MFIDVKCHMCGADAYDVAIDTRNKETMGEHQDFYKITDHGVASHVRIVTCRQCGLSYLNPQPDPKAIVGNYVTMVDDKYLHEESGRRASARYILKYLNRIKPEKGKLLDIGCAAGFFLDEARKDGWDVTGVELSQWATDHAITKLHLNNIHQGTLDEVNLKHHSFDAIVMTDVIEHLIEPMKVLEQIRMLLKANGVVCCNTPDIGSWMSRILGAKWWGIKQSHLFYFNQQTLTQLFNAAGFSVIGLRSHARTFSLGYWFGNLSAYQGIFKVVDNVMKKFPALGSLMLSVNLGDQVEIFARRSRKIQYIEELEQEEIVADVHVKKKVIVVLPAYNAAKTLEKTLKDIPKDVVHDIILVDDKSTDNTVEVARSLGLKVVVHDKNKGYGANQKTCYREALALGADIVVMVHPDYQYDPRAIPNLIEPIAQGKADAVFGSRMMKGGALEGGMPGWKYKANILLTALENVVLGIYLTEYHSGFRAYSRKYLLNIEYEMNSDGFVFDTEIIVQGVLKLMKIEEAPIRTRYFDEASSIKLWPSIIYGLNILKTLCKFVLHRKGFRFKQFT